MSKLLNRARLHFGKDTRGLLDGGRFALVHTRSLEFDDLRPYVAGDDVGDIDWKASAWSGTVLIKQFLSERHHRIVVVADVGYNVSALSPLGEIKRDIAVNVMGAIGLISMKRSDEIGLVAGDARGTAHLPMRRGESHVERLMQRYYSLASAPGGGSDVTQQLSFLRHGFRAPVMIVVISDEPDVTAQLETAVAELAVRHEMFWVLIGDMPVVGSRDDEDDGYDVTSGRLVLNGATLGPAVVAAYQAAERSRAAELDAFMTRHGIRFTRIAGSSEIRKRVVELTRRSRRAD